jgi:hypothetical protein
MALGKSFFCREEMSGISMDLCFDTSGINRLYDDPDRDAIVSALLAAGRVLISGLNVTEAAATEETGRRIELLRLERKLIGTLRPLHVPNELLQAVTIAYAERRPAATITIGDRQQGLWWALEEPESLDEEARQEVYAWKRALEDPFTEAHRLARPEFQQLFFSAAQDRPLSASKLIKMFRDQERIAYDAVAPLWKRLIGTELSIESYRDLMVRVPQWSLYLASWAHAMQNRAIRERNYGAGNHPGAIDLLCAIYLCHCDYFVTDDIRQRRALRVLNVLNPRRARVISYQAFRGRLLLSAHAGQHA